MESFVHVAGWVQPPTARHVRSMSSVAVATANTAPSSPTPSSPKSLAAYQQNGRTASTTALPTLRTSSSSNTFHSDDMSTLPDPRSRTITPATGSPGSPGREPDLNEEVTALSTKLINAINHQTYLDDTLSATRHDLESANKRIKELATQNDSQRQILSGDVWVRRSAVEVEKKAWQAKIAEEKSLRMETEKEKKKIEQELENLTAALFEEANKMVIRAKEEAQADHEAINRKNEQLKAQLVESENLLRSQQEQLSELKHVVENMTSDRDDQTTTNPTAPSSPWVSRFDGRDDDGFTADLPTASPNVDTVPPANPTSFHHLLQPVLRNDIATYDDFIALTRLSRTHPGSRVSSGSLAAGIGLPSLGLGSSQPTMHGSNGSTSSLNVGQGASSNSAPQSPNTPASATSGGSPTSTGTTANLKETKFYKRVLTEDIEPTLRLDAAPGLSWLARRSVISSVTDGSLVVDPVTVHAGNSFLMSIAKPQYYPCSLCGENRGDPQYLRNHRFRTSEQDSAQRYPLCSYCLGRLRSTCDFLSFLRMVKDGHWRADDDDHEKAAWEESVRLREQMFWARIGGGVIPCGQSPAPIDVDKSPVPGDVPVKLQEPKPDESRLEGTTAEKPESKRTESPTATQEGEQTSSETEVEIIAPGPIEKPSTPPAQTDDPNAREVA